MLGVDEALALAPAELRPGLEWFHARRGEEIAWPSPSPVESLEHVVTSAKGIYKPKGHEVALSVRQVLNSPYADREPVARPGGGWVYAYHQEGSDPATRDSDYTNVALMANIAQRSPVAVLIQTKPKPGVRYEVKGLALVTRWEAGFFYLEGFDDDGEAQESGAESVVAVLEGEAEVIVGDERSAEDALDPEHDARIRTMANIVRRRGQATFRSALLDAYGGRCALTGCGTVEVLDAAHIRPYRGDHTNTTSNGLLLRADIHTLFDLGLIAIDPVDRTVIVAKSLSGSEYEALAGARVGEPLEPGDRPTEAILRAHIDWCGDRF